ncbi:MAG: FxsA family protein [Dehalococcoidia bacterium]
MRRSRLRWIPLIALLLGAAEFVVLLGVIRLAGFPFAMLSLIFLSLIGAILMRTEGMRAWRRLRTARQSGGPVGDKALDGVVGLTAALLLLVPGYVSALTGLLLFVPPIRKLARNRMRVASERRVPSSVAGDLFGPRVVKRQRTSPATNTDEVIEGEIID